MLWKLAVLLRAQSRKARYSSSGFLAGYQFAPSSFVTHWELIFGLGRDQVRNQGLPTPREGPHQLVKCPSPSGCALMLAEIFQPRFDEKCFQKSIVFANILEHSPSVSAVTPPLLAEILNLY
jgi:hypothetical protein